MRIERDRFLNDDGSQFDWVGHIDFMLYYKSLDGFPIEDHLATRQLVPDQVVCTFLMAHYIEHRDPRIYGDRFFAHLKAFARALKNINWYWMPILFADAQILYPNKADQQTFFHRVANELAGESNVFPSLANEMSKNGIDPYGFTKPSGNFWSRGSEVGDKPAPRPYWDWTEWHPRRDYPKLIFGIEDAWYVKEGIEADGHVVGPPLPIIVTEPLGFWDRDVPGRRSSDPNLARVFGGTARYYARGINFHSEEGLHSEPWTGRTRECAEKMAVAMRQP